MTRDHYIHFGVKHTDLVKGLYRKQIFRKIFELHDAIRKNRHRLRQVRSKNPDKTRIRAFYTRYADDFVIIGNFNSWVARLFKDSLAKWLLDFRAATLSEKKTVITDIRRDSCHFLGFEISASNTRRVSTYFLNHRRIVKRTAGWALKAKPDRQRLINRLFMKGYCTKIGFPLHIPWLSGLEAHTIIERFNAVMIGLSAYYCNYISSKSSLSRWLYILRFSCLKTLAHKYNTTIRHIYEKFANGGRVVKASFSCTLMEDGKPVVLEKQWTLLSSKEAILKGSSDRKSDIIRKLILADRGLFPMAKPKGNRTPRIFDEKFLYYINWINWRTLAQLSLPCAICGSLENLEMHHIKAIRKRKYVLIPIRESWTRIMSLRNRNQICICKNCHLKIHKGLHNGIRLKSSELWSDTSYDNRLISIENYVVSGKTYQGLPLIESLVSKGWKKSP